MVYAVIDTNIFVSAFITKNATASTRRVINSLFAGKIKLTHLYINHQGKNKSHRDCLKNPTEPAASFFCTLIPPPLELYNIYKRRKMIFFLSFLIHIRFF